MHTQTTRQIAHKLAFIAGISLHACGAKSPLLDNYPPNDSAHFDGNRNNLPIDPNRCGVVVPCERAVDGNACSLNTDRICTQVCTGRRPCTLVCTRAPDDCARWVLNDPGPLPPPELVV
jgi:hypothetical protein